MHGHWLLDLTDGEVHQLIMIRKNQLVYWDNLTPQQAYLKQLHILLSSQPLIERELKMTAIREEHIKEDAKLQVESELSAQLHLFLICLAQNSWLLPLRPSLSWHICIPSHCCLRFRSFC